MGGGVRWLYWKALLQATLAAVAGLVVAASLAAIEHKMIAPVAHRWAQWIAIGAVSLAIGFLAVRVYQLARFEQGHGWMCNRCTGPLGGEINGRYGLYRKCAACGSNVSERRWLLPFPR